MTLAGQLGGSCGFLGTLLPFFSYFNFSCTYEIDRHNRERIRRVSDCEVGQSADSLPCALYYIFLIQCSQRPGQPRPEYSWPAWPFKRVVQPGQPIQLVCMGQDSNVPYPETTHYGKPLNFPRRHFMTKNDHKSLFFECNTCLGIDAVGGIFWPVPIVDWSEGVMVG